MFVIHDVVSCFYSDTHTVLFIFNPIKIVLAANR